PRRRRPSRRSCAVSTSSSTTSTLPFTARSCAERADDTRQESYAGLARSIELARPAQKNSSLNQADTTSACVTEKSCAAATGTPYKTVDAARHIYPRRYHASPKIERARSAGPVCSSIPSWLSAEV